MPKTISTRTAVKMLTRLNACIFSLEWLKSTSSVEEAWKDAQPMYLLWIVSKLNLNVDSLAKSITTKIRRSVLTDLEKLPYLRKYKKKIEACKVRANLPHILRGIIEELRKRCGGWPGQKFLDVNSAVYKITLYKMALLNREGLAHKTLYLYLDLNNWSRKSITTLGKEVHRLYPEPPIKELIKASTL